MKGQTYVILALIFTIIVAVFAIVNVDAVEVNYIFWSGESPLILVILFSALMGGIITATVGSIKMFKLQRQLKKIKGENQESIEIINEKNIDNEVENTVSEADSITENER
ncbi:LapA family protein [Oceanobacillus halophilus]|uniref:DUF1049 domain-containing protein n=1 Tax=Oceanobacillus halophilus TaxID=930130 RepID=A0A495AD79_9BACI|nr:lipopolysaccharide assembly protein LapA domain-containing protein [Oceanobacillus halophilus]RKQ37888.1 DUF1049 domain-containing protein [Oceanobacillus halophilus]